jgi:glycosidase
VNPEFWQAFVPAMLRKARAARVPNFHIFGEVAADGIDVAQLARHTRVDRLPSVLDFGFAGALRESIAGNKGTDVLARLFQDDSLYEGGGAAAQRLPTFSGNHDFGRFAMVVRRERPGISDAEILERVKLSNAMLFLLRGVPVIYYGDEQGFVGRGIDQDSRQDMFASKVASYNSETLLGSNSTTATANFNRDHPLYKQIAELAALRSKYTVLRGGKQVVRAQSQKPGLFAVSRFNNLGREMVIAFNTSTEPLSAQVEVDVKSLRFDSVLGKCNADVSAPGSLKVDLPPLGYVACLETAP